MNMPRSVEHIARNEGFLACLAESERERVLSSGRPISVPGGAFLFRQGDEATACFLVLRGRLKLTRLHEAGKELVLGFALPGELAGGLALFKKKDYPENAQSVGDADLVRYDTAGFFHVLEEFPGLTCNLLSFAVNRLDELAQRYLALCAERVEQRIARALLRIMQRLGKRTDDGVLIDLRLSREDLANYTGTTLYTVSRVLSSWERSGWIKSGRERITITDPHSLVLFSDRS